MKLNEWSELFKNRNAKYYAVGQASSQFGSFMTKTALSLYVLHETNSATQFSGVLAIAFLPQILLYPFSGVLVDRIDRKKLLIICDFTRAAFQILLCLSFAFSNVGIFLVYFYIFFMSVCDTFFNPASNSIVPFLFEKRLFDLANAFTSWILSSASFVAPALGAAIFGWAGVIPVVLLDALSFIVGGYCSLKLQMSSGKNDELLNKSENNFENKSNNQSTNISASNFKSDFMSGFALLKRKELLFPTLGIAASRCFIDPVYSICMPFLLISYFHAPDISVGITQSSAVVGVLLAPFLVTLLRKKRGLIANLKFSRALKIVIFAAFAFAVVALKNFGFSNVGILATVVFCFTSLLGAMVNSTGFAFFNTFVQSAVERHMLGRFSAIRSLVYAIVTPLGIALYGAVLDSRFLIVSVFICVFGAILETFLLKFVPYFENPSINTPLGYDHV